MVNKIRLQPLRPKDYTDYINIGTKAYDQHYEHIWFNGDTTAYLQNSFTKEVLLNEEKDAGTFLFLIQKEKKNVGILKYTLHKEMLAYAATEVLFLDKIYILKEFSGMGIGTTCMALLDKLAKKHNKKKMFLGCMQKGPALSFYQLHGFTIVKTTHAPFAGILKTERPMYMMMKEI